MIRKLHSGLFESSGQQYILFRYHTIHIAIAFAISLRGTATFRSSGYWTALQSTQSEDLSKARSSFH